MTEEMLFIGGHMDGKLITVPKNAPDWACVVKENGNASAVLSSSPLCYAYYRKEYYRRECLRSTNSFGHFEDLYVFIMDEMSVLEALKKVLSKYITNKPDKGE